MLYYERSRAPCPILVSKMRIEGGETKMYDFTKMNDFVKRHDIAVIMSSN